MPKKQHMQRYQILHRLAMFYQAYQEKCKQNKGHVKANQINNCPFWKKGDPGLLGKGFSCEDLCEDLFKCTTCPCDYFGPEKAIEKLESLLRREGML